VLIDNLTYTYLSGTNRLGSLVENAGLTAETWDAEAGSFTYDANGNLTSAPEPYSVSAVTYDPANLPLSITRSGVTSNYRYDDAGQRITKQVGTGNSEVYLREGATVLGVFTMSGGTVASSYFNILWEDRVVGRHTSANVRSYYHFDHLGSVRAVVSNTGAVLESSDFDPWGLAMPGRALVNATPVKERFSGKERDAETGLDYFGARYHMSAIGRWTSVDPSADGTPQWSPYNYVEDNPLALSDRDGRQAVHVARDAVIGALTSKLYNDWLWGRGGPVENAVRNTADMLFLAAMLHVEIGPGVRGGTVSEGTSAFRMEASALRTASAEIASVETNAVRARTMRANATQGAAFEQRGLAALAQEGQVGVVPRVTVRTQSGVRVQLDAAARDGQTGVIKLTEFKSSETAPFTPNQATGYPEIAKTGGVVVGQGKPGFPGGTSIPRTEVKVVRPKDLEP
jgi:RHS repeat-associated protein